MPACYLCAHMLIFSKSQSQSWCHKKPNLRAVLNCGSTSAAWGARSWDLLQQFRSLQVVQEGADNQFLSSLSGKQRCLEGRRFACSHFWCLLVLKLPMGILPDSFVASVYLAKQAWYLLKQPAKLALCSLGMSSCCLLRELEVFACENFACI